MFDLRVFIFIASMSDIHSVQYRTKVIRNDLETSEKKTGIIKKKIIHEWTVNISKHL